MREIKFRMWDHFNEEMTYSEGDLTHFFTKYNLLKEGGNDPILMQFTGLLDKNGKEIYEGEVCRMIGEYRDGFVDIKLHVVDIREVYAQYQVGNAHNAGFIIESLGNIHDNPELLEEAK